MFSQALFLFCASVLLIQGISAQYIGSNQAGAPNFSSNLAANRPWAGFSCGGVQAVQSSVGSGGGFTVSSTSPIAPTGVTVFSDNAIEGPVEIVGQLPVLSAVALEGPLATEGAAGTNYSCGNGEVGIAADSLATAGIGAGNADIIRAELSGIGARISGIEAGITELGAGFANRGLLNAGIGNAGFASAGLNAGLAGARLGRPGCGNIY